MTQKISTGFPRLFPPCGFPYLSSSAFHFLFRFTLLNQPLLRGRRPLPLPAFSVAAVFCATSAVPGPAPDQQTLISSPNSPFSSSGPLPPLLLDLCLHFCPTMMAATPCQVHQLGDCTGLRRLLSPRQGQPHRTHCQLGLQQPLPRVGVAAFPHVLPLIASPMCVVFLSPALPAFRRGNCPINVRASSVMFLTLVLGCFAFRPLSR